jgi:heat-inducible transcriptional repressor
LQENSVLDQRKAAILNAVVEEYIETAEPVGSAAVSSAKTVSASPATVRSDMAALEADGFLAQPHTSAGRVPTEKAYRYFVDSVGDIEVERKKSQRIASFFREMSGEIESLMQETAKLLANLTDYAAIVVDQSTDAARIHSIELVQLSDAVLLAIVVMDNGEVIRHTIEDAPVGSVNLSEIRATLMAAYQGAPKGHTKTLAPGLGAETSVVAGKIVDALVSDTDGERVYTDGASKVVQSFGAIESVSRVLTILERQLLVVSMVTDVLDRGMRVAIGSENRIEPLEELSVVVSPYRIDGETAGSIAVLGPTRMHYPQAMATVAALSRQLGSHLSEN